MSAATQPSLKQWYKVREASEYTAISIPQLYNLMNAGMLAFSKVGKCRRISKDALDALMVGCEVPARAGGTGGSVGGDRHRGAEVPGVMG